MEFQKHTITKIGTLYLIANIFEKAIAFFLLPVFTDLLPTADYGIASTYISYLNIIGVFICLSLGNSLRGAINDYKKNISEYMSSVLLVETVIACLISIIIIVVGYNFYSSKYHLLVVLCPIHAFFSSVIAHLTLRYMLEAKYVKRTILSIFPTLISIFISIFLILKMPERPYLGRILGLFIVFFIFGIICYAVILSNGHCIVKFEYIKYAFSFSLPLVFHGLSLIILNQMDRVMITHLYSTSESGIYSVAYNFGTIAIAFTSAMNDVWVPWFNEKMTANSQDNNIKQYGKSYVWICSLLSCGVILLSPEVMRLFTNENYWKGIPIVPILVFSNFFVAIGTLPINAMYYFKKTKMIAGSSIFAMIVNLILNYILIPRHGAIGASIATVISYFLIFFLQSLSADITYKGLFSYKMYVNQLVFLLFVYGFSVVFSGNWVARWIFAFFMSVCYIYLVSRKYKLNILQFIQRK